MTDIAIAQAIGTLGCGITAGETASPSKQPQCKLTPPSGGVMSLSILTIPALALPARRPPSATIPARQVPGTPVAHLTHQWLDVYERGKRLFPPLAIVASVANGYLAWALRDTPAPDAVGCSWTGIYLTAVITTLGMVPWTLTVMKSTNGRLRAHATRDDAALSEGTKSMVVSEQEKAKRAREDGDVSALLSKWAELNLYRAAFPFLGACIAFCGVAWMK